MSARKNWRKHEAPMIPAYFIDYAALKEMLEKNPVAISNDAMELMLDYFEEFKMYDKAAVIKTAMGKQEQFQGDEPPSSKPMIAPPQ